MLTMENRIYSCEEQNDIVTQQEVSDEIFNILISQPGVEQNNASIIINRDMLPFQPRYDIRQFLNNNILEEAKKKGFEYSRTKSDKDQLVFIMK